MQESPATAFRQQLESLYSISIEIARLHEMQQVFDRAGVLVNPDHAAGMSSSLKAGLASLASGVDRVVVMLGDQPDVRALCWISCSSCKRRRACRRQRSASTGSSTACGARAQTVGGPYVTAR
jgi:hypothetical protein